MQQGGYVSINRSGRWQSLAFMILMVMSTTSFTSRSMGARTASSGVAVFGRERGSVSGV